MFGGETFIGITVGENAEMAPRQRLISVPYAFWAANAVSAVFPKVDPQIDGVDAGPRVSGTLSATEFNLQSDDFTSDMGETTVTRSITLTGMTIENGGNSLSGTYTETISGAGPDDVTISGTFILAKPSVLAEGEIIDSNGDGCIDESEISAGGTDASIVEYSDVSAALHLYNNPDVAPNLCSPAEDLIKQILSNYYGALNE